MTHRLAEVGAATTGLAGITAWVAEMEIYLRAGVSVVGIVVGVLTGLYYWEAWREKRRARNR